MSQETKTLFWISGIGVVVIVIGFYFWNKSSNTIATPVVVDMSKIVTPDSHRIGLPMAKVVVTEFGDYECPACGAAHPVTKELIAKYADAKDVAFVFRNYPLQQHRNAIPGAQFAEAAGLQGKFWEMHDKIYETQTKWSTMSDASSVFLGYAQELGLDMSKLSQDIKSDTVANRIKGDQTAGEAIGINSTPTFYVNGVKQSGWGMPELSASIDTALTSIQ
jgi:protein-disulfide isomerase